MKKGEPEQDPEIRINEFLRYRAIPLGTELEPFLEALTFLDNRDVQLPEPVRNHLDTLKIPVELNLYVTGHCPFCPAFVKLLLPLAFAGEFIRLTITDGFLFHEKAKADNIQSAPTLLLDEQFRWTGMVNLDEITHVIANRDPARLSASTLEQMLKQGSASQIVKMMLDEKNIFPGFLDLLAHKKWPVRLGAMAAMEELADLDKKLASSVITPLQDRFPGMEDQVKGDVIYVFGEAGDHEILPWLETVSRGSYNPDIKEAAKEAIEKIDR